VVQKLTKGKTLQFLIFPKSVPRLALVIFIGDIHNALDRPCDCRMNTFPPAAKHIIYGLVLRLHLGILAAATALERKLGKSFPSPITLHLIPPMAFRMGGHRYVESVEVPPAAFGCETHGCTS
jgi:hypothetical protein